MADQSRRELLKTLAKGAIYAAPVITTLAAPVRLMAQGPSNAMMMTFCDYFPQLCWIFGGAPTNAKPGSTAPGAAPAPPPPSAPPPSSNQSPGAIAPPGH